MKILFLLLSLLLCSMVLAQEELTPTERTETDCPEQPRPDQPKPPLSAPDAGAAVLVTATGDRIPNFGQQFTAYNVRDGVWSDPSTWVNARVPSNVDVVRISPGTTVIVDQPTTAVWVIGIEGMLNLAALSNSEVTASTILVYKTGSLVCGSNIQPAINSTITIRESPKNTAIDPGHFSGGILNFGILSLHGIPKTTYVRLGAPITAGDTSVQLVSAPIGWNAGDVLLVPDSRQATRATLGTMIPELFVLTSLGSNIGIITPARVGHPGAVDQSGVTRFLPHAANFSRSVAVVSENPQGIRGHVMSFNGATVDVSYILFQSLGRTTTAPIGPSNQNGRFAFHLHRLQSSSSVNFQGNAIYDSPRTGLWVHNTHRGVFSQNVIAFCKGNGIGTQDGTEAGNTFDGNFVIGSTGSGRQSDPEFGHEGVGFWLRGSRHILRNNIVANCAWAGININHFRNAVRLQRQTPIDFSGNEIYGTTGLGGRLAGASGSAVETWDLRDQSNNYVISDLSAWHNYGPAIRNKTLQWRLVLDGLVVVNNRYGWGIRTRAGYTDVVRILNSEINGCAIGVDREPTGILRGTTGTLDIRDSLLWCKRNLNFAPTSGVTMLTNVTQNTWN